MYMVASAKLWTLDELRALPDDGRRYELIDGMLIVNGVIVPGGNLSSLDPAMTPGASWTHHVEVLSPSSASTDRMVKRSLYLLEGVPEYWIVDVQERAVERWRRGDTRAELLGERIEWLPNGATEPLVIDLQEYFASVNPTRAGGS